MTTRLQAKWRFAGDAAKKQLPVSAGDLLELVSSAARPPPKGWLLVRSITGQEGFVPETYCEKAPDAEPRTEPAASVQDKKPLASLEDFLRDELDEADQILASVATEISPKLPAKKPAAAAPVAVAVVEKPVSVSPRPNAVAPAGAISPKSVVASVMSVAKEELQVPESARQYAKSKWAFNGEAAKKQLVLAKGEEVEILRCYLALGWSFGRRLRDGEKGFFPNNYLDKVPDASVSSLQWRVGDLCVAQTSPSEWKKGVLVEVGEKSCKVRFDDGAEKLVGALGITPDSDPPKAAVKSAAQPPPIQKQTSSDLWGKLQQKVNSGEIKAKEKDPAPAPAPQPKLLSPKTSSAPLANASPSSGRSSASSDPPKFGVGDSVWVCNLEEKWVRGEVVGQTDDMWEVVVEATGEMLLRTQNLVRPSKQPAQPTVIVQRVIQEPVRSSSSGTLGSRRGSVSEDFDEELFQPAAAPPPMNRRNSQIVEPPAPASQIKALGGGGVASWSAANQPRRLSASVIKESDLLGAANSGRVVSDKPTPIFTMDGSKRTMMLTPQTTAEGILIEILSRWKMESHVNDCVLVSVVKDEMFVVRDTSPLIVKSKWPLIVSSNKNEIPKCRFLVRCVEGASPKLRELLGDPLPRASSLKHV